MSSCCRRFMILRLIASVRIFYLTKGKNNSETKSDDVKMCVSFMPSVSSVYKFT
jgi:hypothetical protein